MPEEREALRFDETAEETYTFRWSRPDDPYLVELRERYDLTGRVRGARDAIERVRTIATWVHDLWSHDGNNEPQKRDPLSILAEVEQGKRFRCVEYAIVINGCLNALGIRSRVLALKTKDVETRESGAGHVVTEAYLPGWQKWAMVDGQWDAMVFLDRRPLNAVELQRAVAQGAGGLAVQYGTGGTGAHLDWGDYLEWIFPYLFFFDVPLDHRVGAPDAAPERLMLVPLGAPRPQVFQRRWPMRNLRYTHSAKAFYAPPAEPVPLGRVGTPA